MRNPDRVREDYMIYVARAEHWENERGQNAPIAKDNREMANKLAAILHGRNEPLPIDAEINPYRW